MSGGSWNNPRTFNAPRCRHCGRDIYGAPETFYGLGWIHVTTNRERCEGSPEQIAEPPKVGP